MLSCSIDDNLEIFNKLATTFTSDIRTIIDEECQAIDTSCKNPDFSDLVKTRVFDPVVLASACRDGEKDRILKQFEPIIKKQTTSSLDSLLGTNTDRHSVSATAVPLRVDPKLPAPVAY